MIDMRTQYLLEVYFKGTATAKETIELFGLLEKDNSNKDIQLLLDNMWRDFSPEYQTWTKEKKDIQFSNISQKIKDYPLQVRKITNWYKIAAAALVTGIVVTAVLFYTSHHSHTYQTASIISNNSVNDVPPGKDRAFLTLEDGTKIELDSLQNNSTQAHGFEKKNGNEIVFSEASPQNVGYNTLSTPKGGKYKLVLPDGSMVWLNAASTIRFPTAFQGDTREVTLTGEAYFEIAKNEKKPFHVKVKDMDVQVLGTHFNIMAYEDEPAINTTLLEGLVKVSQGNRSNILKPGQLSAIDKNGDMKTSNADIEEIMAWKNDLFVFKEYDFAKIMRQIERWYNVTVVYKHKLPGGQYSGEIGRNNNISQVLNILQASGVSFKITDNTVTVE